MKLRPYRIQSSSSESFPFFNVDRVVYDQLLASLKYPLVWAYDELLEAWLPSETTHDILNLFLKEHQEAHIASPRVQQIFRGLNVIPPMGRRSIDELKQEFQARGHVKLDQLVSTEYCKTLLNEYYFRFEYRHDRLKDMEGISRSSLGNIPLMRLIHQATEKLVNRITEVPIKTSYSFSSNYDNGSSLPIHTDRPQCVFNISLILGSNPSGVPLSDWPLWIRRPEADYPVGLEPGDAVLYSGTLDPHWRDKLPDHLKTVHGVFFHYVPENFEGTLD